jgi:3-hydroxyacyl-CoA dehydrogenase
MADPVRTSRHGDVLVVEIDNPPVNALSLGVPEGLAEALDVAERSDDVVAVVVRGAGRTFVAGADIGALEDAAWGNDAAAPDLHWLLARVEECPKPIVMAIHGTALGGGLELAMAGHYRVAAPGAQVGQPEVHLGIIPGAEGTQRLPRLVGVPKALEMCVTGRPVAVADALAAGLIDEVVSGDLTESAVAFARRAAARGGHVKTRDRRDRLRTPTENAPYFVAARQLAAKVKRDQVAPLRAVDAIVGATLLPFDDGCRREREIFFECVHDEQAKALIHVFFAERALARRLKALGAAAEPGAGPLADRLAARFRREVSSLVDAGAFVESIERALSEFGMANRVVTAGAEGRPGDITASEIIERSIYAVVNEGTHVLESDPSVRASDIDVTFISSAGFPAWRGGPMFYADRIGLATVLDGVEGFHRQYGERWTPAPLLVELARAGGTFRDRDRAAKS